MTLLARHSLFPLLIFPLVIFLLPADSSAQEKSQSGAKNGKAIAEKHCARCHVIGAHNSMGGIGSTASFQMIAGMPDGLLRFQTFYARRPHPAFLTVSGVPRWSNAPSYATEFTMTLDQVDNIVAFVKTLEKKLPRSKKRRYP